MEDVLYLYAEPYAADRPVVCFDELPFQLLADTRSRADGGRPPATVDYEYRRQGTANLFLCFEPSTGWRHVEVTARRTNKDFAEQMRVLVDEHYPEAVRLRWLWTISAPIPCRPVPNLSASRGAASRPAAGVSLHT